VRSSAAVRRAVFACSVLWLALLAVRVQLPGIADTRARRTVSSNAAPVCYVVDGATTERGLRCVERPSPADVRPGPPCDDEASQRAIARLLKDCRWHGRRLVLAPLRENGPCVPRLVPLPAPLRIALGIPLDFATATRDDLEALPGVGPGTSRALLAARARSAGRSVDLASVPGIGAKRKTFLERWLMVETAEPPVCRTGSP
jgi:hypothetical protein